MPPRTRTFPVGPTRDALGLVRLLWRIENDDGDLDRMNEITDAGEMLVRALDLGRAPPNSAAHRTAMQWAERAMDRLAALEWSPEYAALIGLASMRVRGEKPRVEGARDHKRKAQAARG